MFALEIRRDDLRGGAIQALLADHLRSMYEISPPESVHALDLEELRRPEVSFWSAWDSDVLVGCGALLELTREHAEVKSMRTVPAHRRRGVARTLLAFLIEEARRRGYRQLSLETGSMQEFLPARQLYASFGFDYCAPFGDYIEDPNSVFMSRSVA